MIYIRLKLMNIDGDDGDDGDDYRAAWSWPL